MGSDFATMAKGGGLPQRLRRSPRWRTSRSACPAILTDDGPIFVELHTGLAENTPMTAGPSTPFHQQVAELRAKVTGAR